MLILSRELNEQVLVGDDIIVTVVAIRGDRVRLGFTAPDSVHVDRAEHRERIDREGRRRERTVPRVATGVEASVKWALPDVGTATGRAGSHETP